MSISHPPAFSDELLRSNGILDLDSEILLHPAEAAMLVGITVEALERARKAGDLPPFQEAKPRAAVLYTLNDVLTTRQLYRHAGTAPAEMTPDKSLVRHLTFNRFLSLAKPEEKWPFVMVSVRHVDRPVDFFLALTLPAEKRKALRWLTFMDYLTALRSALETEPFAEFAEGRHNATIPYGANLPSRNIVRSRS